MEMREINGITLYELPNYAYQKFKQVTRGNERITHDEAQRKLTRNIMLGRTVHKDSNYNQRIIMYGYLKIRINTTIDGREVITGIWNLDVPDPYFMLHQKNHRKISKKLGLKVEENKKHVERKQKELVK